MTLTTRFNFVIYLFAISLFIFPNLASGQAINDTCTAAIDVPIPTVTPFEGCVNFSGDLNDGTVNLPGLCSGNNDLWYTFTAQGPNAIFEVTGTASVACISVGQWDAGDCASILVLNGSENTPLFIQNNLTPGEVYYISVSFDNNNVTDFNLCIQNPPAPTNNDPCTPVVFSLNSCADYTTLGGDNIFGGRPVGLPCSDESRTQSTVWFEVTPDAPNNILELLISGNQGEVVVAIWPNDCSSINFNEENCSDGSAPIIFENPIGQVPYLIPGVTYLVSITTYMDEWDDFNLCINQSFNPACAPNQNCGTAEGIAGIVENGPIICVDGCNGNMPPSIFDDGVDDCFDHLNGAAWYSFPSVGGGLDIIVVSTDLLAPRISVFASADCTTFEAFECSTGFNGMVELQNVSLPPSGTIYIAVSDGNNSDGDFTLCLDVDRQTETCNTSDDLVVTERLSASGVPSDEIYGPYCPGDLVTFCYRLNTFLVRNVPNCQWLQGIIPTFGDCWALDVNEEPSGGGVPSAHGGTWAWYDEGELQYKTENHRFSTYRNCNGRLGLCESEDADCVGTLLDNGVDLPAGWYGWIDDPNTPNTQHPNTEYGDGNNCNYISGPWEVCFTLEAKGQIDCASGDCASITDCSVSVRTTADGESGSYTGGSECRDDEIEVFSAQLNCSGAAEIIATYTEPVCSETSVNIELGATVSSSFTWTATALSPGLTGFSDGSGNRITDFVSNTSGAIGTVEYHVFATPLVGCPGDSIFTIDILPEVTADAGPDDFGCADACLLLGLPFQLGTPDQNPDWIYAWTGGIVSDPGISNPTACPSTTTTYTLTVTDMHGCPEATDQVTIEILPVLMPEIIGDPEVCIGETFTLEVDYGYSAGYNIGQAFDWFITDVNGNESPYTYTPDGFVDFTLTDVGLHEIRVEVTDLNGCITEAIFQVNVNFSPDISITPTTPEICAGASVDLTMNLNNPLEIDLPHLYAWANPAGDSTFDQVITATVPGEYFYRMRDGVSGCETTGSIVVGGTPGIIPTDAPLTECDEGNGMGIFNLFANQININADPTVMFSWFSDMAGTMPITSLTDYMTSSGSVWVVLSQGSCTNPPFEVVLTVRPLEAIVFSGINSPYCILDNTAQLSAMPTGGVFSGSGITAAGIFDPATGSGDHTIYYEVTPVGGCPVRDSVMINVLPAETPVLGATPNPICVTSAPIIITADLSPGTFTGPGITDATTGAFDPAIAGVGSHTVNYSVTTGCANSATLNIEVTEQVSITMSDLSATCENVTSINFTAMPAGGVYSGIGIINPATGEFNPDDADPGDHTVYYTLTTAGGCVSVDSAMVTVEPVLPAPSVNCAGVSTDSISYTWNTYPGVTNYIINTYIDGVPDVVDANITDNFYMRNGLAEGVTVTIEVVFVGINSCGNSPVGTPINPCMTQSCVLTPPDITAVPPLCQNADPVLLSATPLGGNFSGAGVDITAGTFDPVIAGPGTHPVVYSYLDDIGCPQSDVINIIVDPILAPPTIICGQATQSSVEFSWSHPNTGVTDFEVSYSINAGAPVVSTTANTSLIVSPLQASDQVSISIIALGINTCGNSEPGTENCNADPCDPVPIDLNNTTLFCANDGIYQLMASPSGGEFSGYTSAITNDGMFNPMDAGDGDHTIIYTLTRPGGCVYTDSTVITVDPVLPAPVVTCSGVGLDEVNFSWDPVPGVTNYIINTRIDGVPDEVNLNSTSITYMRGGLPEGVTVTITVSCVGINSCGDSQVSIEAMCTTQACVSNPPSIMPAGPLCVSGNSVNLSATPTTGSFSGIGVNAGDGSFDPTIAGVGMHKVTYSYTDALTCPQLDSMFITVEDELPPPTVNCIGTTTTSVEFGWSHNDALVTGYEVSYQINGGSAITTTTSENSLLVSSLAIDDSVSFSIVAVGVNSCGNSAPGIAYCIAQDCPANPISLELITTYCQNDGATQIIALPLGGELTSSGSGLDANGMFDPAVAGVGEHMIIYLYDDGGNCFYQEDTIITVYEIIDPPVVSCTDQTIDAIRFDWTGGSNDAEYIVTYTINNGALEGPFNTEDNFYQVTGLNEGDDVEIFVEILNQTICGNSLPGQNDCVAYNCDIVIAGVPDDVEICDFTAVEIIPEITGSGTDYMYRWTTPMGEIMTKDIMALDEGEYRLDVIDDRGCEASTSFNIIHDPLLPLISISDPNCFGDDDGLIRIDGISGGSPDYQISLNGSPFGSARLFTSLSADRYDIVIRDAEGCTWSNNFELSDPEEFIFNVDTTTTVNYGDSLIFNVEVSERTDSLVTFKVWLTSDPNIACSDCWTLLSLPTFTTNYVLNIETANGCPGDGILRSIINHDRTVYIPNVFRPGSGDSRNQLFQVFTSDEVEMVEDLQIFNRWGDRMFSIDAPYDPRSVVVGWDGIYRGELATTEVYMYWIRVRFTDGTQGFFNGDVTLLR